MYNAIVDILAKRSDLNLKVCCHTPLKMLFVEDPRLSEAELKYLRNAASHVDFLIYNSIRRAAVMGIEVDGFHNHEKGTRQYVRDRMKDHIFEVYGLKLLRFPTNGSGEVEKIEREINGL